MWCYMISLSPHVCVCVWSLFSPHVKFVGYADDIKLFVKGHSLIEARGYMQRYLDEIGKWCTCWQFKLNPAKCSYQVFTSRHSTPAVSLRVSNRNIQYVMHQKVLGFYFDSPHLNFKEHVRQTCIACLKRLQVLRALSSVKWGASHVPPAIAQNICGIHPKQDGIWLHN